MKDKAIKWLNSIVTDDTTKAELDIIEYLKRLVRQTSETQKQVADDIVTDIEIQDYFDKIYVLYPRKVNKVQARTTFEHKLRGMKKDEAREKALKVYYLLKSQVKMWASEHDGQGRKVEHIPHFSTWLSGNVYDSPCFSRRKK